MQQSAMTLTKGPSPLLQPTIRPFLSTLQNCCFCSLACLPLGNSQGQCRLLFTTVSPGLSFKQYLTQVGCSMNASLINARPDTELPLGLSLFCTWKAFLTLLFEHVQVNHTFFFLKVQPLATTLSIKPSLSPVMSNHFSLQNFPTILYVPSKN